MVDNEQLLDKLWEILHDEPYKMYYKGAATVTVEKKEDYVFEVKGNVKLNYIDLKEYLDD